jgi:hypothetical protein
MLLTPNRGLDFQWAYAAFLACLPTRSYELLWVLYVPHSIGHTNSTPLLGRRQSEAFQSHKRLNVERSHFLSYNATKLSPRAAIRLIMRGLAVTLRTVGLEHFSIVLCLPGQARFRDFVVSGIPLTTLLSLCCWCWCQ